MCVLAIEWKTYTYCVPSRSACRDRGSTGMPSWGTVATSTPVSIVWKRNDRPMPSPTVNARTPGTSASRIGSSSLDVR